MFNATNPKIAKQTYSTPSTLFRRIFVDSTPPQAAYNSIRITDRIPVISSKATWSSRSTGNATRIILDNIIL